MSGWLGCGEGCLLAYGGPTSLYVSSDGQGRTLLTFLLASSLIPSWGAQPHDFCMSNYFPKAPSSNTISQGEGLHVRIFWGKNTGKYIMYQQKSWWSRGGKHSLLTTSSVFRPLSSILSSVPQGFRAHCQSQKFCPPSSRALSSWSFLLSIQ